MSVGAYRAAAYDPLTGQEIWRVSYGDGFSNVPRPVFGHRAVYHSPVGIALIGSYHPSRQNTHTGRLTPSMLADVFVTARDLIR